MAKKIETETTTEPIEEKIRWWKHESFRMIVSIVCGFIGFMLLVSLVSFLFSGNLDQSVVDPHSTSSSVKVGNQAGVIGASVAEWLVNRGFGLASFIWVFFFCRLSMRLFQEKPTKVWSLFLWCSFWTVWGALFFSYITSWASSTGFLFVGGSFGGILSSLLTQYIGATGTFALLLTTGIVGLILLNNNVVNHIRKLLERKPKSLPATPIEEVDTAIDSATSEIVEAKKKPIATEIREVPLPVEETPTMAQTVEDDFLSELTLKDESEAYVPEEEPTEGPEFEITNTEYVENEMVEKENLPDIDPTYDLRFYKFPTFSLLKQYEQSSVAQTQEEYAANKERITTVLENFNIKISRIKATPGPTVTLYEIVPELGVRIQKIRSLEDDIALRLSAIGIRIIAPIPGKGTIGIEIPNKDPQIVSMHSVITSKKFQESHMDLPMVLGKTITNEIFMIDLAKMPHLLVAGATGQGKSVGLNAIITSLLYKKHPAELKFVLIDPKKVEFSIYQTIENHFLAKLPDEEDAIITDVTKVVQTLNSITREMDDRYDLLKKAQVRNIKEYNDRFVKRRLLPTKGHRYLPYIVVVIDEFGDLIMTAGKEVELPIARIAQLARAVGIHMIIATQRPSTNIITGSIKANFPARIAFRVASSIDSRTILDGSGANQLIGRGDLLFSQGNEMVRVQCAFVDTDEVEAIADHIAQQQGYSSAFILPEATVETNDLGQSMNDDERDPLFDEVARTVVASQQGSTSYIQRRMKLGYNRAGRLTDQLEKAGIVGPASGAKPRDVLVQDMDLLEKILKR